MLWTKKPVAGTIESLQRQTTALNSAMAQTEEDVAALDEDVTNLKSTIVKKADKVGTYPDLTAGTAEQLMSSDAVEDAVPYLYRKSGGGLDIGNRETLEKIVGGTVAWNQLLHNGNFESDAGWTSGVGTINVLDNEAEVTLTSLTTGNGQLQHRMDIIEGHKYISKAEVYSSNGHNIIMSLGGAGKTVVTGQANKWITTGTIRIASVTQLTSVRVGVEGSGLAIGDIFKVRNVEFFDLTQMFGSTIADYLYTLEQTTAGAGVAWFRSLFPDDYYEYNAGELVSVSGLQSHDTVGFNLWDEEWLNGYYSSTGVFTSANNQICTKNMIPVFPNTAYCITVPLTGTDRIDVAEYDRNDAFLRRVFVGYISPSAGKIVYTANSDAHFINVNFSATYGKTYKNDICINLSGSRNGEYEPYEKHSYPLDSSLTLRGIPKLDAQNNLYFDSDEYLPDGTVNRKYGIVDLGTLTWTYISTANHLYFRANLVNPKRAPNGARSANLLCAPYTNNTGNNVYNNTADKLIAIPGDNDIVMLTDFAYTDAATFKTAMSGVMLVYELATPVIETADPYAEIQICSDWGTEEFVTGTIVPVGHLTRYPANLRDKLQNLPSLADSDGDYIVRQSGSQMSLVGLGDTEEVTEIKTDISKLKSATSAQGIYVETESKPIVSISDGADDQPMKAVKVAIEPVQDLHGYDSPWPAGSTKNLLEATPYTGGYNKIVNDDLKVTTKLSSYDIANGVVSVNVTEAWGGRLFATKPLSAGTYSLYSMIIDVNPKGTLYITDENLNVVSVVKNYQSSGLQADTQLTVADNQRIAVFIGCSSVSTVKVQNFMVALVENPMPSFIPFENICPISGWTGANVTMTGKNLLDANESYTYSSQVNLATCKLPAGTYAFSADTINNNPSITGYLRALRAATVICTIYITSDTKTRQTGFFTLTEPAEIVIRGAGASAGYNCTVSNLQIEFDTATDYEPYNGQTYDIAFPSEAGTVYGGTLDVATGELTVDRAMVDGTYIVNNLSSNFEVQTRTSGTTAGQSYGISTFNLPSYSVNSGGNYKKTGAIGSNCIEAVRICGNSVNLGSLDDVVAMHFAIGGAASSAIRIYAPGVETLDELKGVCANTQIVYYLAAPVTYHLTPQEVRTILGQNNIWADAGNTSVTYPADTKFYIDKKIAELQALILENNE